MAEYSFVRKLWEEEKEFGFDQGVKSVPEENQVVLNKI
jgi:hypothetical protein